MSDFTIIMWSRKRDGKQVRARGVEENISRLWCFLIGVKMWFVSDFSEPLEDCSLKVVKLWFI